MAFDPAAYGQMLDEALGLGAVPGAARPPLLAAGGPMTIDGAQAPGAVRPPMRVAQATPGAAPPAAPQARPGGQVIGAAPPTQQPGRIQGQPPFKVEFKEGALGSVKTTADLVDAMKPESQTKYMDWWEGQYGAINQRYDDLQRQLGRRPDPKGDLSRKEQFRMLMEFGIELMARSGRGEKGAAGTSLANAYGRAREQKAIDTAEHDTRSALIEKYRGDELKAIGSYGDALKGQSTLDQDAVQMEEARARMKAAGRRKPEIISSDQGNYDYDPELREARPILGIDGKPLTNFRVGARGGVDRDTRPSEQKKFDHLVGLGLPKEAAMRIAYRQASGDPRKDYLAVFKTAMTSNFGDEKKAKQIADAYIQFTYPGEELDSRSQPMIPANSDPLGLRD